ncbi:MAG TPA: cytochrome c [Methylomirabilota bacterium]|nr:cytochrome c [Methylomirabilota bacterium]
MRMRDHVVIAAAALTLACAGVRAESPDLGRVATPDEVAAWDISIEPSGAGLPAGSGTARTGAAIFAAKCAGCHGETGGGKPNDQLVGGSLTATPPVKTVGSYWPYATTLFDYIRRAMPLPESKSLSNDEVYALAAYILAQNKIIGEDDVIDARTLPQVTMPNRDGFVRFERGK